MATDKQIEANRINAQKCCGPTSAAGLARSSQNAFKTGIYSKAEVIRIESQDEYEALTTAFHERFAAANPEEVSMVDALIRHEWLSRRYMRADTAIWEKSFENSKDIHVGQVFQYHSAEFTRAGQLYNASRRGFNTTLKQLRQTQTERAKEPTASQPTSTVTTTAAVPPTPTITANPTATVNPTATANPTEPRLEGAVLNPRNHSKLSNQTLEPNHLPPKWFRSGKPLGAPRNAACQSRNTRRKGPRPAHRRLKLL